MFSRRFRWNLEPNRFSLLLKDKRSTGRALLDLTESNPTQVGLEYPKGEILSALSSGGFDYEPRAVGLAVARDAVSGYYLDHGVNVDPNDLLITTSTSEGYAFLFKLLADPGDDVLVPAPSYPLLDFLSAFEGVNLRSYRLEYDHQNGWCVDLDSIEDAITPRTRAVVVVNPNNPTGSYLSSQERNSIISLCDRRNLALIVDEVFLDYGFDDATASRASFAKGTGALVFVLSGLSKVCGLPQMKLAWILASGTQDRAQEARDKLELISDTYLSVSTPVQHAAPKWLAMRSALQKQIRCRVESNLESLRAVAENTACRLLRCQGGWYAILEVPRNLSEEDLTLSLLNDDDVVVHPGYFFEFSREAFLVVSLLPMPDIFAKGTGRILNRFLV